jgi:hypothetical protein
MLLNTVEQPDLIPRPAHCDIEAALIGEPIQSAELHVGCDNQRQKDYISLVSLEGGRDPAA